MFEDRWKWLYEYNHLDLSNVSIVLDGSWQLLLEEEVPTELKVLLTLTVTLTSLIITPL
jgi:hypothetical protein